MMMITLVILALFKKGFTANTGAFILFGIMDYVGIWAIVKALL